MTQHGLGPDLGENAITYTCWCGYRHTNYEEIWRHIEEARELLHTPSHLTTIPGANGSPVAGIEIASTPHGDEHAAVEIRMIVRGSEGSYHQHMVLVHRASLPFLIDELENHRLDKDRDPCAACAAQAFAARLTDAAMRAVHTCNQDEP